MLGSTVLTGCGGDRSQGGESNGDQAGGEGKFPVTVKHKLGETVIEREPQRIVTIGYSDHDALLALGVAPIAVRWWYGEKGVAIQPWAQAAAKKAGADPKVLTMDSIQAETVAALNPDLIIGVYSDLDQESYAQLSQITATIGPPPGFVDYGVPWQDTTRFIAQAVGRADEADNLVSAVAKQFKEAATANPQWSGKEVAVANRADKELYVFSSEDPRSRFFTNLGFVIPAEFDQLADGKFFATLSFENMNKLDRDLLAWDQVSFTPGGRPTIERDPLVASLTATKEDRTFFIEESVETAFAWQTVLSLPAAAESIIPQIEQALPKA